MNLSMYNKKKKKVIDPNAPPRPTLLGHEKEMKVWREQFGNLYKHNVDQANELMFLKRKMSRMQSRIDALESMVKRIK